MGSQKTVGSNLESGAYTGLSSGGHGSAFTGYSPAMHESISGSSFSLGGHVPSAFVGYTNGNDNGESAVDAYTGATSSHATAAHAQYSSNGLQKGLSYVGYSGDLSGSSTSGSYSEGPAKGYSVTPSKGHSLGGYQEGEQSALGHSAFVSVSPSKEYTFGKHKDAHYGFGGGDKYGNEGYSDVRYVRGNQASAYPSRSHVSPSYFASATNDSPFSSVRGSGAVVYGLGKAGKQGNKYFMDYALNAGMNYLTRDHEAGYSPGSFAKGGGKVVVIKETRPVGYPGQVYASPSSYPGGMLAGGGVYKSKPSGFVSSSNPGYPSTSNFGSGYSTGSYVDGHLPRGYRSSAGYLSGHGAVYGGYS